MKTVRAAGACLALFAATTAEAATYVDVGSFNTAVASSTTATFNALGSAFYGGPGYGGTGTVTSDGVTVSTSTDYLFSQNNDQYGTGTFISAQQFSPTVVNLAFAAGTALGFNYASGTPLVLTIGGQTFNLSASPSGTLSFFGVTTDSPFITAMLSTTGGGIDLDNVTFGTAAVSGAVPEPATWAMMLLGFGLMGAGLRRRRATAAMMQIA